MVLLALTILALGAREAFAASARFTCQYDGWTFLGYQPSWQACWDACKALHDNLVDIHYGAQGCCSCLF